MLAQTSGATDGPRRSIGTDSQSLYASARTAYAKSGFYGGGSVRRAYALGFFVLGESVLASLSFGVAAGPALLTFVAGSALLVRAS
jgi:hypothetical protein